MTHPPVNQLADLAIILAYREDTSRLEEALRKEGFRVEVQRAVYNDRELTYSRTIRCLLNHLTAWRRAASRARCTLVVESDFVPCLGFGGTAAPFSAEKQGPLAWAFLYAGGPRIIHAYPDGTLEGHACCSVAILVSPGAAPLLVRFAEEHIAGRDLTAHSVWDTFFQWQVMGWGGKCFLPYRHYGEHGNPANPEHSVARVGWAANLPWLRQNEAFNNHHAECVIGPLHFLPPYARGSWLRFVLIRFTARLIGWGRLCLLRVAAPAAELTLRDRWRLYRVAVSRLI